MTCDDPYDRDEAHVDRLMEAAIAAMGVHDDRGDDRVEREARRALWDDVLSALTDLELEDIEVPEVIRRLNAACKSRGGSGWTRRQGRSR